jgi:nucleoside-diphosphate-sugar epimerase
MSLARGYAVAGGAVKGRANMRRQAMRVLVIGGTGFIGPHVVAVLRAGGHETGVFHRGTRGGALPAGVASLRGDRRRHAEHREALVAWKPEVVVDLILSSGRQAAALMETFRGVARRVVAASSMDVYRACGVLHGLEGGGLEPLPLTEDSALRTGAVYPPDRIKRLQSVFAWLDDEYDKIPAERAVLGDPELPGTVLRLPMVYGPGDPLHRFHALLKRMDDGRPAILHEEGFAAWRGSKGYVENVAQAIALAAGAEEAKGRVYNVAEPETLTELEWAKRIAEATGWRGRFVTLPRERTPAHLVLPGNAAQHWVASSRRLRDELGYREDVPFAEGLRRTIAWERAHSPAIDPRQFDYAAEDRALAS